MPARVANFTGRDRQLAALHDLLFAAEEPMSSSVAVHNLGGMGKTSLAIEYAHRDAGVYSGTWWVQAESRPLLIASLAELAVRLAPQLADEVDQEKAARAALQRLSRFAIPFLLIYDSVSSPDLLADLVPSVGAHPDYDAMGGSDGPRH